MFFFCDLEWTKTVGLPTNGRRGGTESCPACRSFAPPTAASTAAAAALGRIASEQPLSFLLLLLLVVESSLTFSAEPAGQQHSCYKKCPPRVPASCDPFSRSILRSSAHFLRGAALLQHRPHIRAPASISSCCSDVIGGYFPGGGIDVIGAVSLLSSAGRSQCSALFRGPFSTCVDQAQQLRFCGIAGRCFSCESHDGNDVQCFAPQ